MNDDEIRERYAWREGEREAMQREMAERQRQIDSERVLAEAHQANADLRSPNTVTKSVSANIRKSEDLRHQRATAWHDYIEERIGRRIAAREKIMMEAYATVLREEEVAREKLGDELINLRERVAGLQGQVDELRRAAEMRASLDNLDERIARVEARSAGMKVIPGRASDTLIA